MTFVSAAIIGGAAVAGAVITSKAAKDAAEAQAEGIEGATAEQRAARVSFEERTDPFRVLGTGAIDPLQQLLGFQANPELSSIDAQIAALGEHRFGKRFGPQELRAAGVSEQTIKGILDQGGDTDAIGRVVNDAVSNLELQRDRLPQFLESDRLQGLEEINPVVSFLRDQGFQQIQESAAAGGRLGAGGTLADLTRFNLDLSATVAPQLQNQRFNQLFNLAGLGANVAAGQGTAGLQTAGNIGNLLAAGGQAQAAGTIGQANALTGGIQNLAGVAGAFPNLFGGGGAGAPTIGAAGPAGTTVVPGGLQTQSGLFIDTGTF